MWENIEAHLEKDNKRGLLPLWLNSQRIWLAAASVAALLFVGAGIWYSAKNDVSGTNNQVAVSKSGNAGNAENSAADSKTAEADEKGEVGANDITKDEVKSANKVDNASVSSSGAIENKPSIAGKSRKVSRGNSYASKEKHAEHISSDAQSFIAKNSTENPVEAAARIPEANVLSANSSSVNESKQNISAELMSSLPYNDLDVHLQKRYVFFRPEIKAEELVKLSANKEYWAGISLMPASFNPDLKVKSAPTNFSYQALSNKKSVSGTSEAGASYALQTQAGMKLSKHWSLEMGVSYLKGNSNYQGGGYLLSANNSTSANVLENALVGIAPNAYPALTDKSQSFNSGAIYVDVSKKSSNNYQYLQLPVQAGFTIYPEKKLSYSLLGGMMANFFLTNDLESASGDIITTTANDEIYRTVNWAATTGLRFNYRLSSKWKASLTGSYQKAVSSGFRSNQSLDVHPYLYGVAWGVRYSF
ncbi:hypothetical protein FEN17_24325 [Dyadobacter luticola]|uniref:Outer membrane protein beta-barrel domain-containing protein n=1 Tax=Dyadobacter luticola TaxID=1979387 RepID=A0A5R9KQC0_9BACT|nr:hypothetical protein FEN17_24325 [Dyadobacter luticola]